MRIPVPVAVLVSVLVVAGFWWLRTRHMDFMTPRGTERPRPELMRTPLVDDLEPTVVPPVADPTLLVPAPAPKNPDQPPLDFGDLESAPGLAEYSEHAPKGAGYLIRLATELEVRGHWERSLLAWERVVDSCNPSDAERVIAEEAILRIRPTLTFWNIDPEGDLPILLQLGTARRSTDHLKEAAQAVAEFIRKDSDQTVLVTPRLTTASGSTPEDASPIAIYFSGTGMAEKNETDLLSLNPADDEVATYQSQLLAACYQLVRRRLLNTGGIVPPRQASHPDQPEHDFTRQITRLHWKFFAHSLMKVPPEQ